MNEITDGMRAGDLLVVEVQRLSSGHGIDAVFLAVADDVEGGIAFHWHHIGGGERTTGEGYWRIAYVLSQDVADIPRLEADPRSAGTFGSVTKAMLYVSGSEFYR